MGQPLSCSAIGNQLYPAPDEQIVVEVATTRKEKERIYRLRYDIYVKEMGRRLTDACHRTKMLYDDMDDNALLFYARAGKEIVGTVRLHIGFAGDFPRDLVEVLAMDKFQDFRPSGGRTHPLAFVSKGMIAPQYRSSQAHTLLTAEYYETCRRQGVVFCFVGCAPYLVSFHEHFGARRYKSNFFVPGYGCMVPLVNLLEDVAHLKRSGSPFALLAQNWTNLPESAEWFAQEFPDAPRRHINKHLTSKDELWRLLSDKLGQPPAQAIDLFRGLSEEEAMLCANTGHIVFLEQADTLVYPDDMSNELFINISGILSVSRQLTTRRLNPTILKPGQAFGEKTFLSRTRQMATVTAQTEAEVLILPRHTIERLTRQHPETAAKLCRNLDEARQIRKFA